MTENSFINSNLAIQDDFWEKMDQVERNPTPANNEFRHDSEIVIAFVAAVGVNLDIAEKIVEEKLIEFGYNIMRIRVTKDVLPKINSLANASHSNDFERIWSMMDVGTHAREQYGNDIIALGIASIISKNRESKPQKITRTAYLVHSLKHPDEVRKLREIYPRAFYLIGVHAPPAVRTSHLLSRKGMDLDKVKKLMDRDKKENPSFGQQLVDTFHLADFFAGLQDESASDYTSNTYLLIKNSINRFVEILFAHPNKTPTFGEYAMHIAFSAALRSADLSRQVGAVIAREGEILSTGANDCPKFGGGLYWPFLDEKSRSFIDFDNGRDYKRSVDPNRVKQNEIIRSIRINYRPKLQNILKIYFRDSISEKDLGAIEHKILFDLHETLKSSQIRDLTEYGRVVHAEMEALLSCARQGISTKGATLYSTTFPCHNCAKHILAAGINRVVFVEPYLKSKALEFHNEAIEIVCQDISENVEQNKKTKLSFEPFSGIGPRRFFDLFSIDMGIGHPLRRKDANGQAIKWSEKYASLRINILNSTYIQREKEATIEFERALTKKT